MSVYAQKYAGRGFSVLGFPSNDFGRQEPGTPEEITPEDPKLVRSIDAALAAG